MTLRAAIYARYSSDNQRDASIEDQVEVCRRYIARQGWTLSATPMTTARKVAPAGFVPISSACSPTPRRGASMSSSPRPSTGSGASSPISPISSTA